MTEGVVYTCELLPGTKPLWMKSITGLVRPSALTKNQMMLAQQVSEEYFTPLGKTLKHFLPKETKERTNKKSLPLSVEKQTPLRATLAEKKALKVLAKSTTPVWFASGMFTESKRFLCLIGKMATKQKSQALFLVPEITLIYGLVRAFRQFFPEEKIAVLHSKLTPGAYFKAWEEIRAGRASLIIGTRQALFAPFSKLSHIVMTEEEAESYKQWDMSPRYHGRRVALLLSKETKATLILTSHTMSTETLLEEERGALVALTPPKTKALGTALTFVNLRLERYRKNFSPLSSVLIEAIRETLSQNNQILLYINRQGMNAFSVCEKCKATFRCPQCEHPLTSTHEGHFRCVACRFVTGLFPSCPTCGHLAFRHIGFGTEKVEREVVKFFPGARVSRLDRTKKNLSELDLLSEQGYAGKIDILIGTQMVLRDPPLPRLGLVAMIDADNLLLFPHYRADEKLLHDLGRAVDQVKKRKGRVLIQTFHQESAFFQKIVALAPLTFLSSILEDRLGLFYPPYARFVIITLSGKTLGEVTKKGEKLLENETLQRALSEEGREARIGALGLPKYEAKKKLYESSTLLRLKASGGPLSEGLRSALKNISREATIDVDPLTPR